MITKDLYCKFISIDYKDYRGRNAKNDLSLFFKRLKLYSKISYIWGLEYQSRENNVYVPHFHILINDIGLKNSDIKKIWCSVIGSSDFGSRKFGCKVIDIYDYEGLIGYISKSYTKYIPKKFGFPGRWWSCSRNVSRIIKERQGY